VVNFLSSCGCVFFVASQRFAQTTNLGSVIMSMRSIDREPMLGGIRSTFGMCAFSSPIFVAHKLEQLSRSGPRAAECIESRSHFSIVIVQTGGVRILIIALNHGTIFNQQTPQSYAAGRFAVGKMMNNLGGAPFTFDGVCRQRIWRKIFQAAGNFVLAFLVMRDQFLSFLRSHES